MEAPDREHRRRGKRLFLGILLAAVVVVMGLLITIGAMLFGPNPPIVVSKKTTYITSPLRADGTVDYEEWVRQEWRGKATPETNGAIPFWMAMWGHDLDDPTDQQLICKELGMDAPLPSDIMQNIYGTSWKTRIEEWLHITHPQEDYSAANDDLDTGSPTSNMGIGIGMTAESSSLNADAEEVIGLSMERPWTREELPVVAEWVGANQRPFELLHQAAEAPHFYPSSPSLANNKHESLIEALLPSAQSSREAARALNRRSMMLLGEGNVENSWDDIHACYRLSGHVGNGFTLVELVVSYAINYMANDALYRLLESENLEADLARKILLEHGSLGTMPEMLAVAADYERLFALDMMANFQSQGQEASSFIDMPYIPVSVDWNVAMVEANALYDLIDLAAKAPRGLLATSHCKKFTTK